MHDLLINNGTLYRIWHIVTHIIGNKYIQIFIYVYMYIYIYNMYTISMHLYVYIYKCTNVYEIMFECSNPSKCPEILHISVTYKT